jgi:hypothetical protein
LPGFSGFPLPSGGAAKATGRDKVRKAAITMRVRVMSALSVPEILRGTR